ncbi:pleckstrin-like protein domain-containing family a member 6 [Plakobranchus ocellatus]|uniref:Pleckstrin-like protein domain-containing family a member 6 n=1 Tax=Plakobranchus ocellatus TaxID=259542 RepID=A0AAV4C4H8_9GAST|nr:pleckstrin-like protein domain-containing family a member 6 [Plakobranchus ocellatus]
MATAEHCNSNESEPKLPDPQDNTDVPLRRNSHTIRENRHFISEAFAFLNESLEAAEEEEGQGQEYSNISIVSQNPQKHKDVGKSAGFHGKDDEQLLSNLGQTSESNYEIVASRFSRLEVGDGGDGGDAQDLRQAGDCDKRADLDQSYDGCKSKDSGFASLERRHLCEVDNSEELDLPQVNEARGSDSDDDEEEEDVADQKSSNYENIPNPVTDNDYVNNCVDRAAARSDRVVPSSSSNPSKRNASNSENVYDDLNLSAAASCRSSNSNAHTPCFDGEEENAIALAAENFVMDENKEGNRNGAQDLASASRNSEQNKIANSSAAPNYENVKKSGTPVAYVIPDKGNSEESKARTHSESIYDTVICIDFNATSPHSAIKLSGKSESLCSDSYLKGMSLPSMEDNDKLTEFTEYLTPVFQHDGLARVEKQDKLSRMDSLDDDEEEDIEDSVEESNDVFRNAEQDYDTINLGEFGKAGQQSVAKNHDSPGILQKSGLDQCASSSNCVAASKSTSGKGVGEKNIENCSPNLPNSRTSLEKAERESKLNRESSDLDRDKMKGPSQISVEDAENQELDSVDAVITRRPKLERNLSAEIGSDDSSDEDIGIYAESFRHSNWIRVSTEGNIEFTVPNKSAHSKASTSSGLGSFSSSSSKSQSSSTSAAVSGLPRSENLEDIREEFVPFSPRDEVFSDPLSDAVTKSRLMHRRSDSTTTTASEVEFKQQYVSRRRCLIQRADSQKEYHRLSARVYASPQQGDLRLSGSQSGQGVGGVGGARTHDRRIPADIRADLQATVPLTPYQICSPADLAGVVEGHILVSVNDHNVLVTDHADIVKLIQSCEGSVRLGVASSDFQPVRDLQAVVMSGFMYKLGNSAFVRTWKKRYFILRQDNCLYYYKNDQDNLDPLGALPLCGYTISRHTDTSKDFCFKAEKYGARTYYFMTDNRDQLTEWVGALTEAAARSKKRKESFLSVSSHNVGLPALDIRRPECSGNLGKLSPSHRSWRRRYCVLKDACVYYYKDVNSLRALGVAHLHGYKVDAENHPRRKHSFSLQPPESKMRNFHFAADNETDKKRWVESLIHSIQRWVPVDREADC